MASEETTLKEWQSHKNFKRVKCWLNGHKKFVVLSRSLKEHVEEDILDEMDSKNGLNDNQYKTLNVVNDEFNKLISMIKSHSRFEETQLFPYLYQTFKDKFTKKMYDDLLADHKDHCFMESDDIFNKLDKILNKNENNNNNKDFDTNVVLKDLYDKFETFEKGLVEHLKQEESFCVELWLNMTDEQYKEYKAFSISTNDSKQE